MKQDGLVSVSELARIFNLDRATVAKKLRGVEPFEQKGYKGAKLYKLQDVIHIFTSKEAQDEAVLKLRKIAAEAEKAEIVVAQLKGDLVPIAQMRDAVHTLIKSLFQRCVIVAPRQLASRLLNKSDAHEVEIILRNFYSTIFEELRASPSSFLTNDGIREDFKHNNGSD